MKKLPSFITIHLTNVAETRVIPQKKLMNALIVAKELEQRIIKGKK